MAEAENPLRGTVAEGIVRPMSADYKTSIRRARPADAAALAALAARTFRDTYEAFNTPQDLAAHLADHFTPEHQARELADPAWDTLVAESTDGALVAYAQLCDRRAPSCVTAPAPRELARLYVDREHHGTGLAHRLMDATLACADEQGASTVWLGVWEENPRARAFYTKMGFEDVGEHIFVFGNDPQRDRVLVRPTRGATRPVDQPSTSTGPSEYY